MGATREINLGVFNLATVKRLRVTITLAGQPWLGLNSVAIRFEKPNRTTIIERAMVQEIPDTGIWYYDTTKQGVGGALETDLDTVGYWTINVIPNAGNIQVPYDYEIGAYVGSQP